MGEEAIVVRAGPVQAVAEAHPVRVKLRARATSSSESAFAVSPVQ